MNPLDNCLVEKNVQQTDAIRLYADPWGTETEKKKLIFFNQQFFFLKSLSWDYQFKNLNLTNFAYAPIEPVTIKLYERSVGASRGRLIYEARGVYNFEHTFPKHLALESWLEVLVENPNPIKDVCLDVSLTLKGLIIKPVGRTFIGDRGLEEPITLSMVNMWARNELGLMTEIAEEFERQEWLNRATIPAYPPEETVQLQMPAVSQDISEEQSSWQSYIERQQARRKERYQADTTSKRNPLMKFLFG